MGGIGSGRRNQSGKDTTEDSRPLDIRRLHRANLLTPGRRFGWQWTIGDKTVAEISVRIEVQRVVLVYRYRRRGDEDWQNIEQPICLDETPCTYGGTRPWWLCPCCGRRVAVLYGPGKVYACRHCCKLAYACQREAADDRAARRANTIRRRLGWRVGILNLPGNKPKGMHWRTYERLTIAHQTAAAVSLAGMTGWLGQMERGLACLLDGLRGER